MPAPDPKEIPPHGVTQHERWTVRAALWRETPPARTATSQAATDLMVAALGTRANLHVLDVAGGPGEPAITIAAAVASSGGHVVATDLVEGMLAMAAENARSRGVTNITFAQADAEALPYPDASFDAVTCRFAVMLFNDAPRALREMRRVLTEGGKVICMISGPPEQSAHLRPLAVVRQYVDLPQPAPGEPHQYRFSEPGALAAQLREAGFRQVEDQVHHLPVQWTETPAERWAAMQRHSRRMAAAVQALPPERHAELTRDVLAAIEREQQRGDGTAAFVLATGIR